MAAGGHGAAPGAGRGPGGATEPSGRGRAGAEVALPEVMAAPQCAAPWRGCVRPSQPGPGTQQPSSTAGRRGRTLCGVQRGAGER